MDSEIIRLQKLVADIDYLYQQGIRIPQYDKDTIIDNANFLLDLVKDLENREV